MPPTAAESALGEDRRDRRLVAARRALAVGVVVAGVRGHLDDAVVAALHLLPQSQAGADRRSSRGRRRTTAAVERRAWSCARADRSNPPGVSEAVGAAGTRRRARVRTEARRHAGAGLRWTRFIGMASLSPPPSRRWRPVALTGGRAAAGHIGEPEMTSALSRCSTSSGRLASPPRAAIAGRSRDVRRPYPMTIRGRRRRTCATWPLRERDGVLSTLSRSARSRWRRTGSVNGELAGGMATSLMTRARRGIVIAVHVKTWRTRRRLAALRVGTCSRNRCDDRRRSASR